jgi:hypothetical protein
MLDTPPKCPGHILEITLGILTEYYSGNLAVFFGCTFAIRQSSTLRQFCWLDPKYAGAYFWADTLWYGSFKFTAAIKVPFVKDYLQLHQRGVKWARGTNAGCPCFVRPIPAFHPLKFVYRPRTFRKRCVMDLSLRKRSPVVRNRLQLHHELPDFIASMKQTFVLVYKYHHRPIPNPGLALAFSVSK